MHGQKNIKIKEKNLISLNTHHEKRGKNILR
jgi:hypothetical protein